MRKITLALALAGLLGLGVSGAAVAAESSTLPENARITETSHHHGGGRHHNGRSGHRRGCNGNHHGACWR